VPVLLAKPNGRLISVSPCTCTIVHPCTCTIVRGTFPRSVLPGMNNLLAETRPARRNTASSPKHNLKHLTELSVRKVRGAYGSTPSPMQALCLVLIPYLS